MIIVLNEWFKLPFLGSDSFSKLRRAGVKYQTGKGFMLDDETDLEQAALVISSAINEDVEIYLRCFVCDNVACVGCPYFSYCDRKKVSTRCLCYEHSSADFSTYVNSFQSVSETT